MTPNNVQALTRASPRGSLEPVRLYFRGDSSRAEFKDGSGDKGLLADTGLVLGYKGQAGLGPVKEWRVEQVDYGPVPDALFEFPAPGVQGQQPL